MNMPADARVNIRNNSYPSSRSQMVAAQQQMMANANATNYYVTTPSATETLPVAVDDATLANDILNNTSDTVTADDLENCSMIYPTGLFKWGIPESGIRKNQTNQCVAVVELRDANSNKVLAKTTLAAGDAMKCNIDMFPQSGWQTALENIELPADNAPTLEDVESVMNQEQKQNAGLKIVAGALLTGLAGNMLAPKEAGDTKLLGTSKTQLVDTAIGATTGAGVMAASVYSGKVAGDTIKSTAVNAATGAVVGNMAGGMTGGGDTTLSIKECVVKDKDKDGKEIADSEKTYDCIAGNIDRIKEDDKFTGYKYKNKIFFINTAGEILECSNDDTDNKNLTISNFTINGGYKCDPTSMRLVKIQFTSDTGDSYERVKSNKIQSLKSNTVKITRDDTKFTSDVTYNVDRVTKDDFFLIYSASIASSGSTKHAYAVFPTKIPKKVFGYTMKDWNDPNSGLDTKNVTYYARNRDGSLGAKETVTTDTDGKPTDEIVFTPSGVDSDDGALVDFSNAGRMKATLTGAAAGGALGGFSGYQGAKQEVQERWLSATREYNDSLSAFYCGTGTRFLSKYNDYIQIPNMQKSE